jgi:hypothetical protein
MPTDNTQPIQTSEASAESLDDLFCEAEGQAGIPVIDHPKPCEHPYDAETHRKCPTCLWMFCFECASLLDPRYCKLCLSEPAAELKIEPLVDTEGHVVTNGRHLTPLPSATFFQPRFGTLAKTISEMSDVELEEYVKQYTELVRQAERALDFRRVVLGSSQMELTQREDIKRRKLRADKTKYPVKTTAVGKPVTQSVKLDMLRMLEALQKLKIKKDADAKAKAVDAKMKEPRL